MKNPLVKYKLSKILYIILLEISLPIDVALGIVLYELINKHLINIMQLMLVFLLASSILGITLYLIHLWQMEYLTKNNKNE